MNQDRAIIGFIGAGGIARGAHMPGYQAVSGVKVIAVCDIVKEAAERLAVELIFLPTYSPNLNLIERVWKLVKKLVLNTTYTGLIKL